MALRHLNLRFNPKAKHGRFLYFPLVPRLIFTFFCMTVLGLTLVMYSIHIIAILVFLICLVGVIYREDWIVDAQNRVLIRKFGLLWPYVKKAYPFDLIKEVTIKTFKKETELSMVLDDDSVLVIDTCQTRNQKSLAEIKSYLETIIGQGN